MTWCGTRNSRRPQPSSWRRFLEWPVGPIEETLARTLRVIAGYYKLKNAEDPTNVAAENARKYDEAAIKVAKGEQPRINAAKSLVTAHGAGVALVGDPVADWKAARRVLQDIAALNELFREVRLVRLFRATDALASGLGERWLGIEQLCRRERAGQAHTRTGTVGGGGARPPRMHPDEHAQSEREGI